MEPLTETLRTVEFLLTGAVGQALNSPDLRELDDEHVLGIMNTAASIVRRSQALVIGAVAELQERGDSRPHDERPTTKYGCRSMKELVQRATLASGRTATDSVRVARAIQRPVSLSTGEELPAEYPGLRRAAADGAVGLDALVAIVGSLDHAHCERDARLAADAELAASACGAGADGGPRPSADDLRLQAQVWAMYLDQDGAEPREVRALRKRGFTLGLCRDGVVPCRGNLLPEVASQVQRLLDSILNPKGDGPDAPARPHFVDGDDADGSPVEHRTRAMQQHDALAMVMAVAARSGEMPTIGGSAPILVVSVSANDLQAGRGHAHIDGCDEPVSIAVARQVACVGAVQRVTTDEAGRILAIDIIDRVFAAHQRRAISLRDGGCVIPGCHVPATWCEIHHVTEHSLGGPTHTDNGVLLCWHHHRTLDSSGWKVRMRRGIPEVRGPSWWDSSLRWRAVTKSPTRLSRTLRARGPGG